MSVRSIALLAALALAMPPAPPAGIADAAQSVKQKQTRTIAKAPRYKKNFRGTRPGEPNYAELPDNCWGAKWDGKDWLCFNSFDFGRFND
jgi:hypothetical protein